MCARTLRVLQVTEASGSGTFEVVRTISAGAAETGHEILVALGRRPETSADAAAALPAGIDVVALPWNERTVGAQVRAARALRQLAQRWHPDVVHLHSSFAGAVGAVALAGRWPTIYTPHGSPSGRSTESLPLRWAYRTAEAGIARRCTIVGAVSHAEARLVMRKLRAPRVAVVANGITELDHPPAPLARATAPLVVAMGRIAAQRRPEESARILSGVSDLADVRWVGGAANHEDAPLRRAGVQVTGWLDRDSAVAELASATAYVNWSAWDGLPLAVLEAMARDVVVVASDIPANRELLGDEQVRSTPAEAVALLRAVLQDAALREHLLEEQRRRRGAFGAARMVAEWCALYESVAAGEPRPLSGAAASPACAPSRRRIG